MLQRSFYQTSCSETDVICEGSELKHRRQAYQKIALTSSKHVVNGDRSNLVGVLQSKSVLCESIHRMESNGCEELYEAYEAMDKLALHHSDPGFTNTAGGAYAVNEDLCFSVKDFYRAGFCFTWASFDSTPAMASRQL